jgi:hypothetical protein
MLLLRGRPALCVGLPSSTEEDMMVSEGGRLSAVGRKVGCMNRGDKVVHWYGVTRPGHEVRLRTWTIESYTGRHRVRSVLPTGVAYLTH